MVNFALGVLFMLCIGMGLYIRYLIKNPKGELEDERTVEQIRKEEEFNDHYNNILNYNPAKAYGGKK